MARAILFVALMTLCEATIHRPAVNRGIVASSYLRSSVAMTSRPSAVTLTVEKPLGLVLEELVPGSMGVAVGSTVEGSNAERSQAVQPGDRLLKIGERDVSSLPFDAVMALLVEAESPIQLTLQRAVYPDDEKPLDITPNLAKTLKPDHAVLVDRVVRAVETLVAVRPC